MIAKIIYTITIVLFVTNFMAQMKVTDLNGKTLSSLSEKNKDVKLNIAIPAEAQNHELVQFGISLRSKTKNRAEEISIGLIANGECVKDYKSSSLKDKKTIDLWALKSDNTSDFTKVFYDGDVFYFQLNDLKNITARNEQFYDLSIGVFGKDITSYEYKQDNMGNTIKQPIYSFTELASYSIEYDAGKPASLISSRHETFFLPKIDQNKMSLWISPPGDAPVFGNPKPYEINGKDEAVLKSQREDAQHFYVAISSMPLASESIESLKDKVAENLVRDANGYNNYKSEFHWDDRLFVPEFCTTFKTENPKSSDVQNTGGLKGKLNKLKEEMNTSSGNTEEKIVAKVDYAKSKLHWTKATIGGVACEKTEINVYTKNELTANSSTKLYEPKPDKKDYLRPAEIYLVQTQENVFFIVMFKHGKDKTLTSDDMELRSKVLEEIKFK